jgi:uncharacterized membrane protein (UPF0127 family)
MITFKEYIRLIEENDRIEYDFITKTLTIKSKEIEVEVADDSKKRSRGLMGREQLKNNKGMLFILPRIERASFWMKNTKIPLSIAYIDPSCNIVEIHELQPDEDKPTLSRSTNIAYALEVPKGWFDRNKIEVGDLVQGLPKIIQEDNMAGSGGALGSGESFGHGGDFGNSDFYATGYAGIPYVMGSRRRKRVVSKKKRKNKKHK